MKNLTVSLLIALLSLNTFAQDASDEQQDSQEVAAVESQEQQRPSRSSSSRQQAFNARGVELFEQAISESPRYRLTISLNGQMTHTESKTIKPDSSSEFVARGFAEQMRHALEGKRTTAEGAKLKFKCQQNTALSRLPGLNAILKPGLCRLTLETTDLGQRKEVVLTFIMELTDTAEHNDWPSRIISPEIKLDIIATDVGPRL